MSSSKRGLCWPTSNPEPIFPFTKPGSQLTWLYNWSPLPTPSSTTPTLSFVPMQWNHVNIEALAAHVATTHARELLAFNEPELPDQANMSPALAAEHWLTSIEPLRRAGVRCGSPGISSAPHGVEWLEAFLRLIRQDGKGDVDFYALHWYGESLGGLYDYLWSTYYRLGAGKKVWLTEFACTNWRIEGAIRREVVEGFARESCKYLDSLEWVERYAWFGAMKDCGTVGSGAGMMAEGEGELTRLGREYRDGC